MRWIISKIHQGRRERGAAALIVAALFTSLTVVAVLALSVDMGNAMVERRVLQNGADAAAMALAEACAKGDPTRCQAPAVTALVDLAGANAKVGYSDDGFTAIPHICGNNVDGLDQCPIGDDSGDYSNITKCLPAASRIQDLKYVEVQTETQTGSVPDNRFLPRVFSQMLTGGPGLTVEACARAAWGAAGGTGRTLPLVSTMCDFKRATANGLAPKPPYSPGPVVVNGASSNALPNNIWKSGVRPPKFPVALLVHDNSSSDVNKCGAADNGQTYPGGFSWALTCGDLRSTLPPSQVPAECAGVLDSACVAAFTANGTALVGSNGAAPANACKHNGMDSYVGTTVYIPVASGWDNASKTYRVDGIAAFYLAGLKNIPGGVGTVSAYTEPSDVCNLAATAMGAGACNPGTTYIWGWFTSGIVPVSSLQDTDYPKGGEAVVPAG